MTDAEALVAFTDIVDTFHSLMGNYLTVLFAFLVTSYLAADKLDRAMAVVVLALFSIVAAAQILEIWMVRSDITGLGGAIAARVAAGESEFSWHGPAAFGWAKALNVLTMASVIGGYVAAIVFFFHERKIDHDRRPSFARPSSAAPADEGKAESD